MSGVAPEALQQGVAVARNITRQLQGRSPQPFRYFNKVCSWLLVDIIGFRSIPGCIANKDGQIQSLAKPAVGNREEVLSYRKR